MIPAKHGGAGLRQALAIIDSCAQRDGGCAFGVVRRAAGELPAATCSRLLKILLDEEWIEQDDAGAYRLGPAARMVAVRTRPGDDRGARLAGVVADLARASGESAGYTEWVGDGYTFRCKHEMPDSYHYLPLGSTGTMVLDNGFGTVCLAYQRQRIIDAWVDDSSCDPTKLRATLARIRADRRHCSTDKGIRFLAPVFTAPAETFAGTIGISLPPRPLPATERARFRDLVDAAARRASHHLTTNKGPS